MEYFVGDAGVEVVGGQETGLSCRLARDYRKFCDGANVVKAAARPPHSKKGTRHGNRYDDLVVRRRIVQPRAKRTTPAVKT